MPVVKRNSPSLDSTPVERLTGKKLEQLILLDARWRMEREEFHLSRYGVQATIMGKPGNPEAQVRVLRSLPDFEGILPGGRQFIFESKVCSGASFQLSDKTHFAERQLSHLLARSALGAISGILVHFSQRILKTRTYPPATYLFPVLNALSFWEEFSRGEVKSLPRVACEEYGIRVLWWKPAKCKQFRPDLLTAIRNLERSLANGVEIR